LTSDVLCGAVEAVCAELMEGEVSELVGAQPGERRPDDRATHLNGYRSRWWDTRAGEIELQIPKIRQGSYFPSFLEPRRRSEQELLAVGQQAYVRHGRESSWRSPSQCGPVGLTMFAT
jgi:putative transposase